MNTQSLDHEHFEAIKALGEIGVKISAGKAELDNLDRTREEFLEGRAQEAIDRVSQVLEESRGLLNELAGYHSELVGFRNAIDIYVMDVRNLIQSVERWKAQFDETCAQKNKDIDAKLAKNTEILKEIKQQRARLAGEAEGVDTKRAALKLETIKINDEWATLGRAQEEINGKK